MKGGATGRWAKFVMPAPFDIEEVDYPPGWRYWQGTVEFDADGEAVIRGPNGMISRILRAWATEAQYDKARKRGNGMSDKRVGYRS